MAISQMHFALRLSEPDRATCGRRGVRRIYVGETVRDEGRRRLRGQLETTCRLCRTMMCWSTPAPVPFKFNGGMVGVVLLLVWPR
jgi:hypothetical protein